MVFDSSVSSKRELSVLNPVEPSHQPRALLLTHAVILSHYDADAVTAPHGARHRLSGAVGMARRLGPNTSQVRQDIPSAQAILLASLYFSS